LAIILWPFGIYYGYWYISWPFGNLGALWYIYLRFGIFSEEKSGNPDVVSYCPIHLALKIEL
jgi:hypothetical protein